MHTLNARFRQISKRNELRSARRSRHYFAFADAFTLARAQHNQQSFDEAASTHCTLIAPARQLCYQLLLLDRRALLIDRSCYNFNTTIFGLLIASRVTRRTMHCFPLQSRVMVGDALNEIDRMASRALHTDASSSRLIAS
jgi:hypothetical protein